MRYRRKLHRKQDNREQGALVIFDGLDEVLVHLTPAEGQRFTNTLHSLLAKTDDHDGEGRGAQGKMLLTCRTHFFPTLRQQKTHFTGEDREQHGARDYLAFELLPFTEAQIRTYLTRNLPDMDVDRAFELIESVHNLRDLAERPYTLSVIGRHIGTVAQWQADGRTVTGATLYREMVQSWLERDTTKHQLEPYHKERLMEALAAAMWRDGRRLWAVERLEQWLIDFLQDHPRVAGHYEAIRRELLKEDLRAATFLVRQQEASFRFAHSSLQEYFLAAWLKRTLLEGQLTSWDLPLPSPETLDFLAQLIAEADTEACLIAARAIREQYRPRVSEVALAWCLRARAAGLPSSPLAGFRLEGAMLRDWRFEGGDTDGLEWLDFAGAHFDGADLDGAQFRAVHLDRASFAGADLSTAEFLVCRARQSNFDHTRLVGTAFRRTDLSGSRFTAARCHRTQFIRAALDRVIGLGEANNGTLFAMCDRADNAAHDSSKARAATFQGHSNRVSACAFDPDGQRLASASSDNTVRLWNPDSGECLRVLEGHSNWVTACAFDPDGRRLASASYDNTVRLWDPDSGAPAIFVATHFPKGQHASIAADGSRIIELSPEAWRWVGRKIPDPETGHVTRWPAETFGPIRILGEAS